jgi:hypothetical protein
MAVIKKTLTDATFAAGFHSSLEHVVQQALVGKPEHDLALVALASGIETAIREQNERVLALAAEHLRKALLLDESGCAEFRGRLWAFGVLARVGAERVSVASSPAPLRNAAGGSA